MLSIIFDGIAYKFGKITSFSDSFSKNVSTTPIVSLSTDCTFPLETGASLSYNVSFTRISPQDYDDDSDDSDMWCNATWMNRVSSLVNRWQMKSDGYHMIFREYADDGTSLNGYVPSREDRVYIKKLSFNSDAGYADTITGSMQLRVGSVRTSSSTLPIKDAIEGAGKDMPVPLDESYLILTSPNTYHSYLLQYGQEVDGKPIVDCVNSYTLCGGPGIPFENIQIKISRKRLTELYPALGEAADSTFSTDILAGKSVIYYRGMGESTMIVSNCKMTSDEYTITAYCRAEKYRGMVLGENAPIGTPKVIIERLLTGSEFGRIYDDSQIVWGVDKSKIMADSLTFSANATVWQVIQLCAASMDAIVYFCNNKAYIIDYSLGKNMIGVPNEKDNVIEINLFPRSESDVMYGRVIGQATYGNEGQDTIINVQSVSYRGASNPVPVRDEPSIQAYGHKEGFRIDLTQYFPNQDEVSTEIQGTFAQLIGTHIVNYSSEPQKSISFKVKELVGSNASEWAPLLPTCACSERIVSSVDGISISNATTANRINGKARPQKLYLSSYERSYPSITTEYTFGVIDGIDLQDTLSKIQKG